MISLSLYYTYTPIYYTYNLYCTMYIHTVVQRLIFQSYLTRTMRGTCSCSVIIIFLIIRTPLLPGCFPATTPLRLQTRRRMSMAASTLSVRLRNEAPL